MALLSLYSHEALILSTFLLNKTEMIQRKEVSPALSGPPEIPIVRSLVHTRPNFSCLCEHVYVFKTWACPPHSAGEVPSMGSGGSQESQIPLTDLSIESPGLCKPFSSVQLREWNVPQVIVKARRRCSALGCKPAISLKIP